jgi:O-antigen ligase
MSLGPVLSRIPTELALIALAAAAAAVAATAFIVSAYAIHPLALPAAVVAVAFMVAAFLRPVVGLIGAALATPLEAVNLPLASGALSPAEAALAVVALAWLARALLRPESVAKPALRDLPVAVLLLAVAAGLLFAAEPAPVLRVAVLWTLFSLVYLQAQSLTVAEMHAVTVALVAGAGLLGAIGAVSFVQSGGADLLAASTASGTRAVGTFADPNYYASLLALALLPGVALLLAETKRNLWLLAPLGAGISGLLFSLSRGGILGFGAGLLLLLAWRRARYLTLAILAVVAALTLTNANPLVESEYFGSVEERISTVRHPTRESTRPQIWATAVEVSQEHPFFGVGVNQFQRESARRSLFERGQTLENAHSVPLSLAAETGLIGLVAFSVFLAQLAARGMRAARARTPVERGIGLGISAALLAFVIQGMTITQIRVPVVTGMFFLLAGILTGLSDRDAGSVAPREPLETQ